MAVRHVSGMACQSMHERLTKALALALFEWFLMSMLFVNAIFSYLITKFAHYHNLQIPCLLCSRLDHIFGNRRLKHYWDMICQKHKLEISTLVYCHVHEKLVDVNGICEPCLISFATFNKSNAETYRLLIGKIGEQSRNISGQEFLFLSNDRASTRMKMCTCCGCPWIPRGLMQDLVRTASGGSKTPEFDNIIHGSLGHRKGSHRDASTTGAKHERNLSHVNYTELNIHSDAESEFCFTDNDREESYSLIHVPKYFEEDHVLQSHESETQINALLDDSTAEIHVDSVSALEPPLILIPEVQSSFTEHSTIEPIRPNLSFGHGLEELVWPEVENENEKYSSTKLTTSDALLSVNSMEVLSKDLKERESAILSGVPITSSAGFSVSMDKAQEIYERGNDKGPKELCEDKSEQFWSQTDPSTIGEPSKILDDSLSLHPLEKPAEELKHNEINIMDATSLSSNADDRPAQFLDENIIPSSDATAAFDIKPKVVDVEDRNSNVKGPEELFEEKPGKSEIRQETNYSSVVVEDKKSDSKGPEDFCEENPRESEIRRETNHLQVASDVVEDKKSHAKGPEEFCDEKHRESETVRETNYQAGDPNSPVTDALDLTDAYKIATTYREKQRSKDYSEKETSGKNSRLSGDLKSLLTQLTSARSSEQSVNEVISPKVSVNSEEKSFQHSSVNSMQSFLQRALLERNESNISLEGSVVSEIEGESEIDRLKRQNEHDRKLLSNLYKELEEERNASAIATNQAMAMITRLQEEKATLQMEALQNLRMMEEQSEYDMEALQRTNDLLDEKEKIIQDLEAELEYYRDLSPSQSPMKGILKQVPVGATEMSEEKKNMLEQFEDKKVSIEDANRKDTKNCLRGFENDRLYILQRLAKIEKKLQLFSDNGMHSEVTLSESCGHGDGVKELEEERENFDRGTDLASIRGMVVDLSDRLEALKADQTFLEHIIISVENGEEGMRFIKEIASHMQTLRRAGQQEMIKHPS